jgi:hypothetical protein
MISPLPRNKRAKNPRADEGEGGEPDEPGEAAESPQPEKPREKEKTKVPVAEQPQTGGLQNPFANLEIK